MEQRLTKLWYREDARPSLLQPLSWLYGAVVGLRRSAYSRSWLTAHRVGKPVVVVGNLTVGGTGKTPLVIWLAHRLRARGLKVGIVSRGYGSRREETRSQPAASAGELRVVDERSSWQEVGDEPVLLARGSGCITVVGRDRVAAARALVAHAVDVILADDGLQHLRLARDCEIVVIDGSRGFGNARMLPAGPMREPVSRLAAADLIVVNGVPEHPSLRQMESFAKAKALRMQLLLSAAMRVDGQECPRPLEDFRGRALHAVAGIGNPGRFFRDLRERGLQIIEHPFPDHHAFSAGELAFPDDLPVLMTEKDAVKCTPFANPRLWVVPAAAVFGEPQARELLEHVLRKIGSTGG
jgi:tetraacyldisaccharide 4'-kinase